MVSMEDFPPLEIAAFSKSYAPRGRVGGVTSVSAAIRHNGPGEATFTVPADHPRVDDLTTPGARCVIRYRPAPDAAAMTLLSGAVNDVSGQRGGYGVERTFSVLDDWTVLNDLVGWPNPTGTDAQQGDDGAYWTRTGPAETVAKDLVRSAAVRQGVRLSVPASAGRGAPVTIAVRMHPLTDRLFPTVETAGLGLRVVQVGTTRELQIVQPVTRSRVLTEDSGIVLSGSYQTAAPTVTRVTVGAGGEGEARVFREFVDTARETEWGLSRAVFVDARNIKADDPDRDALMEEKAAETLAEGAAKSALSVQLTETESFRFGVAYNLGDRLAIRLTGAPVLTDYVREVGFEWEAGAGLVVSPRVGDWQDSADALLWRLVAKALRSTRDLGVR